MRWWRPPSWLDRLACWLFGHGPFHEGRWHGMHGRFCANCGTFLAGGL